MVKKKKSNTDSEDDEMEEETLEGRMDRSAFSSEWAWENQPRHRNLSTKFKLESKNLEKKMNSDLKTLSEIETATETMRQYVINGEIYADGTCDTVTVGDCLKVKRSIREKNRSLSLSSTIDDFDQIRGNVNKSTTSEFTGENVFLTAEPVEEYYVPEKEKVEDQQVLPGMFNLLT